MKMTPQQYCLRWKHHHTNVQNMFAQLLEKERFCDVTLYCSPNFATQVPNKDTVDPQNIRGVSLRAHRVVLAACSELLGALLGAHESLGEPVLVIDGAEPRHLRALLDYMYTGEMNVHHSQLASLLKTAEELRIKGLTDIRWNNKDEPPDCQAGVITTTTVKKEPTPEPEKPSTPEVKPEDTRDAHERPDKFSINGGPPPLIKLATKDKGSPVKRENSDCSTPSPKRMRATSGDHSDDDDANRPDRDSEWQHGNMDITAERVVAWGLGVDEGSAWSGSGDEWASAPADIGSFLHTRLRVDGDNSNDDDSNQSILGAARSSCASSVASANISPRDVNKQTVGPKSGPSDPRFTDVVKLNDYLQHGRRPQFWEENYVKRVMEAVRLKELEMKQAAEILGVSYGTLYGRYRDVYGCINRPYRPSTDKIMFGRSGRDFCPARGPAEVLERLQRGDVTLEAASAALGVTAANLAAYVADVTAPKDEFEPIPIEIDPSLKMKPRPPPPAKKFKPAAPAPPAPDAAKTMRRMLSGEEEDSATTEKPFGAVSTGKWPSLRVASLDAGPVASASALMRTRPDLTIVAAKKTDETGTSPPDT